MLTYNAKHIYKHTHTYMLGGIQNYNNKGLATAYKIQMDLTYSQCKRLGFKELPLYTACSSTVEGTAGSTASSKTAPRWYSISDCQTEKELHGRIVSCIVRHRPMGRRRSSDRCRTKVQATEKSVVCSSRGRFVWPCPRFRYVNDNQNNFFSDYVKFCRLYTQSFLTYHYFSLMFTL